MTTKRAEIESWLQSALIKKDIFDYTIDIEGNSEKGDGFLSDIVFVRLSGKDHNGAPKQHNWALKCAKKSEALREATPVQEAFENEIFFFTSTLPAFIQFQKDKGIRDVFDSVPKCYGTFASGDFEIVVLENLRKIGYSLWDKRKPQTRHHLNLVLEQYGKWHAISAAMQDQQPERFKELTSNLPDLWTRFNDMLDLYKAYEAMFEEVGNVLEDSFDESSVKIWGRLQKQIKTIVRDVHTLGDFKIVAHGDCWNNNFMFKTGDNGLPTKVAIIDWQISRLSSPVTDLVHYLFTVISKEDLLDLDNVLKKYYFHFSDNVKRLGSDPEKLYPFRRLMEDWKKMAKFGVFQSFFVIKVSLTEKSDMPDISQVAGDGGDFSDSYSTKLKDTSMYKERMKYIVEYAFKNKLLL